VRPVSKADNLTTIFEPIVYTIWDSQHLTTPRPPRLAAWDSYSFTFTSMYVSYSR
jgi:hypothetical protein